MTTALAELEPVEFGISELDIARARSKYRSLDATSREGYEEVRLAIAELRTTRTGIEKRRVELKHAALEHGRKVDSVAKQLTTLIVDIEAPLLAKKAAVDDEKERIKRETERAELLALEAKLRAEREAEEARLKAERDAEQERLRVETARLAEERAAHDAERRRVDAEQRAAQAQIDAERKVLAEQQRAISAQQREAQRIEDERAAAAQAEQDAREAAARAAEEALLAAQQAEAERARLEAMKPDIDKMYAWAAAIREFAGRAPTLGSREAAEAIEWSVGRMEFVAVALEKRFQPEKAA